MNGKRRRRIMKTYTEILVLFLWVLVGGFSAVAGNEQKHESTSPQHLSPVINKSLLVTYKNMQQARSLFKDQVKAYEEMVLLADAEIDIQTDADDLQRLLHLIRNIQGIPEPHQNTLDQIIRTHAEYSRSASDVYGEVAKNIDAMTAEDNDDEELLEEAVRLAATAEMLRHRLDELSETLYAELETEIERANAFINDVVKRSSK